MQLIPRSSRQEPDCKVFTAWKRAVDSAGSTSSRHQQPIRSPCLSVSLRLDMSANCFLRDFLMVLPGKG